MIRKPKLRVIYVTYPNRKIAEKAARGLVQRQLAGCVNIIPMLASVFEWRGKIVSEKEVAVLIKTSESKLKKAIAFVRAEHPYEIPCIVVYRADSVLKSYQKWLINQLCKNS